MNTHRTWALMCAYSAAAFIAICLITLTGFASGVRPNKVERTNGFAPYILDVTKAKDREVSYWLKGGGRSPDGTELGVNSLYWTKNGKPWLPVMGEFCFLRYPVSQWQEELLKMKACGISIIASYVLWVDIEHPQGVWHWNGNNDLRWFIKLCHKDHLYVWLRIGPYCNAEARNGGLPDWVNKAGKRSNAPWYLAEVKKYFAQLAKQTKGLYFQDGGPIIGIQLENEFAVGNPDHIVTLKAMAQKLGLIAPFYSVTANSRYDYQRGDVLPLRGCYAYRGWGGPDPTYDYLYCSDEWGAMQNMGGRLPYDDTKFPRGMCELGTGSWQGYGQRFVVPAYDIEGVAQNCLGRGINLMGYYMFQGGTQKAGMERGHRLTYDFQAPLGEFGQVRPSYHSLNLLHLFVNDFGDILAPMQPVRPENMVLNPRDTTRLRYAGRFQGDRGFLFLTTCQSWVKTRSIPDVQIQIKLKDETIIFPSSPFTLKANTSPIFPINLNLNGTTLRYATAQLLCKVEDQGMPCFVFFACDGIRPEFQFKISTEMKTPVSGESHGNLIDYFPTPSYSPVFTLTAPDGRKAEVMLLTGKDAEQSWRMNFCGAPRLLLSNANLLMDQSNLELYSPSPTMDLAVFPALKQRLNGVKAKQQGAFGAYSFTTAKADIPLKSTPLPAKTWTVNLPGLPTNVDNIFFHIRYVGSTANLLVDNVKYSDNLNNGLPWEIGIKRFVSDHSHAISVVAKPWDKHVRGIPDDAAPANPMEEKGIIRSVRVTPEYFVRVSP